LPAFIYIRLMLFVDDAIPRKGSQVSITYSCHQSICSAYNNMTQYL